MFRIPDRTQSPDGPDFRFSDAWRENDHRVKGGYAQTVVSQADDYSAYSPPSPVWEKTRPTTTTSTTDVRPLLPNGHPCSSDLSPRSLIAHSREEMMQMIRELPESCYELSLKDIVDCKIAQQDARLKPPTEEQPGLPHVKHYQVKEKKKITRSDSMDNTTFLIKTFFPSFSKTKLVLGNASGTNPMPSLGFERSNAKKYYCKDQLVKATAGRNNINKYREEEKEAGMGCWPSTSGRKSRTWKIIRWLF
uniref:Uncharacterized protein n=1 Tax=Kalanchoe fedtschenkoi TaxID=63787 RepID=A0A7N0TX65_KALFE